MTRTLTELELLVINHLVRLDPSEEHLDVEPSEVLGRSNVPGLPDALGDQC